MSETNIGQAFFRVLYFSRPRNYGLKNVRFGGGVVSITRARTVAMSRVLKNAAFFRTRPKIRDFSEKTRKMQKSAKK